MQINISVDPAWQTPFQIFANPKDSATMSANEGTPAVAQQNGEEPPKTEKQLKKEAEKAAKLAKLAQKNEKKAQQSTEPKEKSQVSCLNIAVISLSFQ